MKSIPYELEISYNFSQELDELLRKEKFTAKYPYLGDRTPARILLDSEDELSSKLKSKKSELFKLYKTLNESHTKTNNLFEYVDFLFDIMGVKQRENKENLINTCEHDEHISEDEVYILGNLVEKMINIYPEKYIKHIQGYDIYFIKDNVAPFTSLEKKCIYLYYSEVNLKHIFIQLMHEFTHVVEYSNPKVQEAVLNTLFNRSNHKNMIFIKDLGIMYNKEYPDSIADLKVFDGKYPNLYAGRVYQNKKIKTTELLTFIMESFIINPYEFLLSDPELYQLFYTICHGKRLTNYKLKI